MIWFARHMATAIWRLALLVAVVILLMLIGRWQFPNARTDYSAPTKPPRFRAR
jgi:hypothetical protein